MKKLIHRFTHRPVVSADQYWRKAALAGELNELFKRPIMSVSSESYAPPFLANPFRGQRERTNWEELDALVYEYSGEEEALAAKRFDSIWQMVEIRLDRDWTIADIGCNTGYMLQKIYDRGFRNVTGIDPQRSAVEWAKSHRPHLNIRYGFFNHRLEGLTCDALFFFKSIFRIPYQDRVFEAIDRATRVYAVFEGVPEMTTYCRDLHLEMAKIGFMCIEKRAFSPEFVPIGHPGADSRDVLIDAATDRPLPHDCFYSNYVFRRIAPRTEP